MVLERQSLLVFVAAIMVMPAACTAAQAADAWQPAKGPLMTEWAKDVSPEKVLPEYPRPQMVRREWLNLNGLWEYAVAACGDERIADCGFRIAD